MQNSKASQPSFRTANIAMAIILAVLWSTKGFDLGIWVYGFLVILWFFIAGSFGSGAKEKGR